MDGELLSAEDAARRVLAFDDREPLQGALVALEAMRDGTQWRLSLSQLDVAIGSIRRLLGLRS